MNVAVIGLGKLGLPLAAVLAVAGHDVIGVDVSAATVEQVNRGTTPVRETGMPELLADCRDRLRATTDLAEAVRASELTFVIVPTPSEASGRFSLDFLVPAIGAVGDALAGSTERHTVVVTSTVMPGDTDGPIRALLEERSGRSVGRDLGLCYSPEFIALGSVIADLRSPDLLLIGESHEAAGDVVEAALRRVVGDAVPVRRMSPVNAEVVKLAVNTYVTMKISFANALAELCEALPGGDVDVVTGAVGVDSRIGSRFLRGATAYGGPCFPRDNRAMALLAGQAGTSADLALATDTVNRRQVERLRTLVTGLLAADGRAAVLGLAYKPNTPVADESVGVALVNALVEAGIKVTVHDPQVDASAFGWAGVDVAPTAGACVASGDVVVVATPWDEYATLDRQLFAGARRTVIDCWRSLPADLDNVADVIRLGRSGASISEEA